MRGAFDGSEAIHLAVIVGALCGAIAGRLLAAASWRLAWHAPLGWRARACPACGTALPDGGPAVRSAWRDLLLGPRCPECRRPSPWRTPLVVLGTAALWALFAGRLAGPGPIAYAWAVSSLAVLATATDLDARMIPNRALLLALVAWVPLWWVVRPFPAPLGLAGAAVFGGALLLAALVRPAGLGLGDVKLGAVLGLYLGWPGGLTGFALGAWAGGLGGLALMALRRASRKDTIPFGPFLAAGALLALVAWGPLLP